MNGYDQDKGTILVPLDLNNEIIKPLERLEDSVNDLKVQLDTHLTYVNDSVKTRMTPLALFVEKQIERDKRRVESKAKAKKVARWAGGIGGPLLLAVAAKLFGAPI